MPENPKFPKVELRALWPLLIPVLLLLPGIAGFAYPSVGASYSDISVAHYPNAIFLKRSIAEWGQIPLWSPAILSGHPFAANPLSGLWYPPGWLALLLPLPFGFNLVVLLHLLIGGLGMYLLLRAMNRPHLAAIFGALVFEAMPKVFAHYGAGHLSMVYAISLTPWLLLAELRNREATGNFWFRQPGIVLALIALADPRWAAYAGTLWLAFSMVVSRLGLRGKLCRAGKQIVLALALAAPLLLPLIEYSRLSTRGDLAPGDVLAFSLPPAGLLGLLAAPFNAFHEWVIYFGVIVLLLAMASVVSAKKSQVDWLCIGVAVLCLLFSLGENLPGFEAMARLPGFSLLRVPPRIAPIAGLAMIVLAAKGLDRMQRGALDSGSKRRLNLVFAALFGLLIGLACFLWLATGQPPFNYLWPLLMISGLLVLLAIYLRRGLRPGFAIALIALAMLDMRAVDASLFAPRSSAEVLAEGAEAAEFLARQPGRFRIYSPSYSIPQQTAAEYGLELADGVDPLQMESYVGFMQDATGVPSNGYSVTLPEFQSGDPHSDNRFAMPDLRKLALLNVAYVVSEFDINMEGLHLAERFGDTRVYELTDTLPRAYIEGALDQAVTITEWLPNRIVVQAEGPGRLVLSELMYPRWVARTDGRQIPIEPYEEILRSVKLPVGSHIVSFEFRPTSVYAGLGICLVTSGLLVYDSRQQRGKTKTRRSASLKS